MTSYKYVMQDNSYDCGIASLMTCYLNMGKHINKQDILDNIEITNKGVNAYDLVKASKKLGISATGVKGDPEMLEKKDFPCIAHIIKDKSYYHYIVILNIDNNHNLEIFDPAVGLKKVPISLFKKVSTNIYIIFNKIGIIKDKNNLFTKYLIDVLKKNFKQITKIIIISIILTFLMIATSYYLTITIKYLDISNNVFLLIIFLLFLNIYLLKNFTSLIFNKLSIYLENRIGKKITKQITNHIFHLPYNFFAKRTTGELSTIIGDTENFKSLVSNIFISFSSSIIIIILILFFISFYSLSIVILSLSVLLAFILLSKRYQNILNNDYIKLRTFKTKYTSYQISSLSSYQTIKNLNLEDKITSKNIHNYYEVMNENNKSLNHICKYQYLFSNINEIYYLFIIFILGLLFINKRMNVENIVLFSSIYTIISSYFNNICSSISEFKMYQSSTDRILDILEIPAEVIGKSTIKDIEKIKVSNLIFNNTINNISFEINKKDKIFVTGPSGSGKSSLMKILLKYYKNYEGKIEIDGINLKYINQKFMRDNITYVSQNESLFNDTLLNNLNIISESKNKIKKALKTCEIDKIFKDNEIDYNYIIEDDGKNLSGGERKRIIIARALLKAKNILILDESFNEVSSIMEKEILNNIFKNYPYLTIIMISHRIGNKKLFNKTIVVGGKKCKN